MGAIKLLIYNNKASSNIDFLKAFKTISHRGPDDTSYKTYSTINLNNLNSSQYEYILTRDEIMNYQQYNFILGYHRLAINDTSYNACQPFEDPIKHKIQKHPDLRMRPQRQLLCNGEIYNYNQILVENNFTEKDLQSNCDVEIIMPLYIKNLSETGDSHQAMVKTLDSLNGEFAIVLTENINTFDLKTLNAFVARDPFGIKPIFYITNTENNFFMFISEMKAVPDYIISNNSYQITQMKPGSLWSFNGMLNGNSNSISTYYDLSAKFKCISKCIIDKTDPDTIDNIYTNIKRLVIDGVNLRLNTTTARSVGVLLSGGFDSCLLASITLKYIIDNTDDYKTYLKANPFHVFTIGDTCSSDIKAAQEFVKFLEDTYSIDIHHHIVYLNQISISSLDIDKIVYILETFDPETVRESIPYYYLFKYIKEKCDVKVLLSGEGLDEFGSYPQFDELDNEQFQEQSVELLSKMIYFDLLKIDKMSSYFGLEVRQPYLDRNFVEYMLSIHPKLKRKNIYKNTEAPIEKYLIRRAFETKITNTENDFIFLPYATLWRRHSCICESITRFEDNLKTYFDKTIGDNEYNLYVNNLLNNTETNNLTIPNDKEEMYYRKSFQKYYPNRDNLVEIFWQHQFNEN
jgi:asparagine synthase (glutamine-hydrolysing)